MKGSCQFRESFEESSIEVEEADKSSCLGKVLGCFPCFYSLHFDWVHMYLPIAYDDSEIFHFWSFKGTFLQFEI